MSDKKKRSHRKYLKPFSNRLVFIATCALVQIGLVLFFIWGLSHSYLYFSMVCYIMSIGAVIYIANARGNPAYKLAWTIPILVFPVFGGLLYILSKGQSSTIRFKKKLKSVYGLTQPYLEQNLDVMEELRKEDPYQANNSSYLTNIAKFPVYNHTTVTYLSPGEVKFEQLVKELKKAQHYIFMEYFIIQEGVMWNTLLEILIEKAKNGVDVRVIYDDMGCSSTLPNFYYHELEKYGIKCLAFNPFVPAVTVIQNNRDHRKIVVIDGHTAFTGGINLADEYINVYGKYGHWKDASVMIKGEAVWSFTVLFLQMWYLYNQCTEPMEKFRPSRFTMEVFTNDGYVQPYGDSPLDHEPVGANVYLNVIHKAKKYIYIMTPYLILDNEMLNSLLLAAKNGLDVRIITPHMADKWYVHIVTQSFYQELIEANVKIYEYTPGFMHSKIMVSDDDTAVVGTINLDFRSLYLHFECATLLYQNQAIHTIKNDFLDTLEVSQQITLRDCKNWNIFKWLGVQFLRLFAPLM